LERFSARLRDEVELDALTTELLELVGDVMQPMHVSLWLRDAGEPKLIDAAGKGPVPAG
jgi:hypothetical protein